MHDPEGNCSGSSHRHPPVDLPGTAVISVVLAAVQAPLPEWPGMCRCSGAEHEERPMPGRLDGKIAIITGAGGAVGRTTALLFAAEGATVIGCDQQDAAAQATAESVRAAGGRMTAAVGVDLGDDEAATAWVDSVADQHGGIDVLFNNPSALRFGPVDELPAEGWLFTLDNELTLVFYTVRAVWPHLRARSGGAIVNVGSIAGTRGSWSMPQSAHAASKGGILGLT